MNTHHATYVNINYIIITYDKVLYYVYDFGSRSTDLDPKGKRGHKRGLVTSMGFVEEADSRDPVRVKTDRCPNKFHKVLKIKRRSTS